MNFISVRIITADIQRLVLFYEQVLGLVPNWLTEDFAEVSTPTATLAIGSTRTLALFGHEVARPASNHTAIIEFMVDNVDAHYETLKPHIAQFVQVPTTMPWGNRSLLLRDPDGNLINLFTPVTDQARKKFGLS